MSLHQGNLHTQIIHKVATVTFGHPLSNSFPSSLLQKLTQEIHSLSKNDGISIIILQSEGEKAFCAGASFNELVSIKNIEQGTAFFSGFAHVINAMRTCSKIIIGRVQGKAVGGGVGLAAACDYVLATQQASIKLSELTIGIGPFVIAPAVERKIGTSGLSELTLDATQWKSAHWAKEKGMYAQVFDTITALDTAVQKLANKISSYNPEALVALKEVLWKGTEHWEELLLQRAELSGRLVLSDATKNALQKFKK